MPKGYFHPMEAWEQEIKQIIEDISVIKRYQGRLAESPSVLNEAFEAVYELISCIQRAFMYARFSAAVDSTNQRAAGMRDKAQGVFGQVISAVAFVQPELLAIGKDRLDEWMSQSEQLAVYRNYFDDLFRRQEHVRSAEVEEILGLVSDPCRVLTIPRAC
jgi:oligoendopeptidase F